MKKRILTWLCLTAVTLNGLAYTIPLPTAGDYYLIANQRNEDNNSLVDVFGTQLPDGTQVLFWNCPQGNNPADFGSYDTYVYDSSVGISAQNWYEFDDFTPVDANTIFCVQARERSSCPLLDLH